MSVYVDIEKRLGDFCLQVQFEAGDEVLALLGASGCGKSLTLRCIAGIERPDRGRIVVDDVTLFDSEKKINLTPQARRTGLMFQNYALFPNMTVLQNIRTGTLREPDREQQGQRITEIMERFGLADLAGHYPAQLSGGQQQRTALARLLVSSPRILLLDEPFSALDSHLRFQLEREVRRTIEDFGKSVILVSHDRDEVFRMSDAIAVMDGGRIEALGRKAEIFRAPQTRRAAVLTGCKNISRCETGADGTLYAADWGISLRLPEGVVPGNHIGIRMHDIRAGDGENAVDCRVVEEIENPFSYTVMLQPAGQQGRLPLGWELDKAQWRACRAETVRVSLPAEALLFLKD